MIVGAHFCWLGRSSKIYINLDNKKSDNLIYKRLREIVVGVER